MLLSRLRLNDFVVRIETPRGGSLNSYNKNFLGEEVKDAFSSGVERTLLCEQVTVGVTSFEELLTVNTAHRGAPSRKEISIPPNASVGLKKQTNLGAKRLEGTSWKAKTPRPPPTEGREFV